MPAEVDSGFYVAARGLPWHVAAARRFGGPEMMRGVEERVSARVALALADADYEVGLRPVYIESDNSTEAETTLIEVPRTRAVVRLDTGVPLSVVGTAYHPLQNQAVADFGEAILDTGEPLIETAAVLRGGLIVFFAFELPKEVVIPGDDGVVRLYLVVINGHDGQTPFSAIITPVRVVCINTVRLAIRAAKSRFVLRHQGDLTGRVAQARQALAIAYHYGDELGALATRLVNADVTDRRARSILDRAFPLPADATDRQQDERVALKVFDVYKSSPNLGNIRGTGWGLVNAVAEYQDWVQNYMGGVRMTGQERRLMATLGRGNEKDAANVVASLVLAR